MPRIYHLSRTATKLLYKVRHHKGHGIHSPFVFSFINRVIEEKNPYYAYEDINTYLEEHLHSHWHESKINKLSFKIVNSLNPKNILELGAGNGLNTLYITAPSSATHCISIELDETKYSQAQNLYKHWQRKIIQSSNPFPKIEYPLDCIFLNLRNYEVDYTQLIPYITSNIKNDSFVFIDGIRTNKSKQVLWKELIQDEKVVVSLDLFDVGILFFDEKFFKKNYKLSF